MKELDKVLEECLSKFPELKDVKFYVEKTKNKLEGAKSGNSVLLWIPEVLWGKWHAIKAIIYHELAHFVDINNPDKVFYERADEKSIELWKRLQEAKALKCEVIK